MRKIEISNMNQQNKNKEDEFKNPKLNQDSSLNKDKEEENDGLDSDDNILEEKSSKKNDKEYWSGETEKAVIEYLYLDTEFLTNKFEQYSKKTNINEEYYNKLVKLIEYSKTLEAQQKKELIFRKKINVPLNRLIENIMFNFKLFRNDVDVKTQHSDCKSFVYSKFSNFDPSQKTKSFSFFGTIAKHYLLGKVKDFYKHTQTNLDYEANADEAEKRENYDIHTKSDLDSSLSLFNHVINEIEKDLQKDGLSDNDKKVGDAIIQIFQNHETIGIYNKNQVYQLIKENTGLQTKDITYSLHRFRIFYKLMKQDFLKFDAEQD